MRPSTTRTPTSTTLFLLLHLLPCAVSFVSLPSHPSPLQLSPPLVPLSGSPTPGSSSSTPLSSGLLLFTPSKRRLELGAESQALSSHPQPPPRTNSDSLEASINALLRRSKLRSLLSTPPVSPPTKEASSRIPSTGTRTSRFLSGLISSLACESEQVVVTSLCPDDDDDDDSSGVSRDPRRTSPYISTSDKSKSETSAEKDSAEKETSAETSPTRNPKGNNNSWGCKTYSSILISFERLGFKVISIGGLREVDFFSVDSSSEKSFGLGVGQTVSSSFKLIDADGSGGVDASELYSAIISVLGVDETKNGIGVNNIRFNVQRLAENLIELYGDRVMTSSEFDVLVNDLRQIRTEDEGRLREVKRLEENRRRWDKEVFCDGEDDSIFDASRWQTFFKQLRRVMTSWSRSWRVIRMKTNYYVKNKFLKDDICGVGPDYQNDQNDGDDEDFGDIGDRGMDRGIGSIELSSFTVDFRQLFLGNVPLLKRWRPGGNLITTPLTVSVAGSFNRADILTSPLLQSGLKRLVARAFKVRVRSVRDFLDGAVWFGRTWELNAPDAPSVVIPEFDDIEFDDNNNIVLSGRFIARDRPENPTIENAFKLRTKIGTRKDGQIIGLENPEIAIVVECPSKWAKNIQYTCKKLGIRPPRPPPPIVIFVPLGEKKRMRDKNEGGFDLGADNNVSDIWIDDGALRFKVSTVLRPGKFLGNHYLAFSVPIKKFIITLERVKSGIRSARKNKRSQITSRTTKLDYIKEVNTKDPSTNRNATKMAADGKLRLFYRGYKQSSKNIIGESDSQKTPTQKDDKINGNDKGNNVLGKSIVEWLGRV